MNMIVKTLKVKVHILEHIKSCRQLLPKGIGILEEIQGILNLWNKDHQKQRTPFSLNMIQENQLV